MAHYVWTEEHMQHFQLHFPASKCKQAKANFIFVFLTPFNSTICKSQIYFVEISEILLLFCKKLEQKRSYCFPTNSPKLSSVYFVLKGSRPQSQSFLQQKLSMFLPVLLKNENHFQKYWWFNGFTSVLMHTVEVLLRGVRQSTM